MYLLYFLYLLTNIGLVSSASCSDSTVGQASPVTSYTGNADVSSYAYVMTDDVVKFTCCGRIKKWRFYARSSGIVKLQVWRLVSGTTYKLVGENSFTVPTGAVNQEIQYLVSEADRIQFKENDYIGWYSPTVMIPYGTPGPAKTFYISTVPTVGVDSYFPNYFDSRNYAILVDVTANEKPYFDNIPAKIHVFDHLAVNTLVLTLQPRDTDKDDYTVSLNSASTRFALVSNNVSVKIALSVISSLTDNIAPLITDSCAATVLGSVDIFIENQKPIITSLPSMEEISETANSETLLHTIVAVDGETLTCQLNSVSPSTTVFKVKETTAGSNVYGIYYVPVSTSGFDFDYDTTVIYDVTVTCSDGRLPSEVAHLMVYILKNVPPEFTNLPAKTVATLPQQLTPAGTVARQVSISDPDSATYTFDMVCDQVANCPFVIAADGKVTNNVDLKTIRVPAYDLSITVNDGHTTVGPKSLSIYISTINDIPEFANYNLGAKICVKENVAIGTTLFTFSTTDLNSGDTLTYTMTSNPNTGTTLFQIGPSNGKITTLSNIDYETAYPTITFTFVVKVTDTKDTATTTVTIEIVDVNEAPVFSGANYIINDKEGVGGTLLASASIIATDQDFNDVIKFTLDCNGYNTTYFEMNEVTARVYFGKDFDTDIGHPPVSVCNVTVKDIAGLTDTEYLTINIADTNDFTPAYDYDVYTVFLYPSEAVGTILGNFTAFDGDITKSWSTLVYALDQSSLGDDYFNIDENGTTTIAKDISTVFTYGQKVVLNMTATDGGGLVGRSTLLLVFPELTTTSTTTTELPFKIETYPDNGYWYAFAGAVLLMNITMCMYLCSHYCECSRRCGKSHPSKNTSGANKKVNKTKAIEDQREKAGFKLIPLDDPWSKHVHENYSKRDSDKPHIKSSSPTSAVNKSTDVVKSKDDTSRSASQFTDSTAIGLSISIDLQSSQGLSSDFFNRNSQNYRQQHHHIYSSNNEVV